MEHTPDSILEASKAHTAAERWDENERLLRDAVQRFPDNPELCLRAAFAVHLSDGEYARELSERAASLAPEDPRILTGTAMVMFNLGDIDQSENYVRRAHALADEDFDHAVDLMHLVGRIAMSKGNESVAERALTLAFEEDPASIGHGRELAEFHLRRGEVSRAREVVVEAQRHLAEPESLDDLRGRIAALES